MSLMQLLERTLSEQKAGGVGEDAAACSKSSKGSCSNVVDLRTQNSRHYLKESVESIYATSSGQDATRISAGEMVSSNSSGLPARPRSDVALSSGESLNGESGSSSAGGQKTEKSREGSLGNADWRELAQSYYSHHFSCSQCIAAGKDGRQDRCLKGLALWQSYLEEFNACRP